MPDRCVAPGCKSNYDSTKREGYVQCFLFPKNEELRKLWLRAIPRENWAPSERSVLCIKHFHQDDLELTEVFVDKDGNRKEFPRKQPVLRKNAVPTIFPNVPHYLSKPTASTCKRSDPEERRRVAEERREEAVRIMYKVEESEDQIMDFKVLTDNCKVKLQAVDWLIHVSEGSCLVLYKLDVSNVPTVQRSLQIDINLSVRMHVHSRVVHLSNYKSLVYSDKVVRWSQLKSLIDFCDKYTCQNSQGKQDLISQITHDLTELKVSLERDDNFSEGSMCKLQFLTEQFQLLFLKKPKYPMSTILNAFLIFMQSVKCYTALRVNNILTLPHIRYLQKLSSSLGTKPGDDSQCEHYLRCIFKDVCELERHVNLQIDEIHIKEEVSYKQGELVGQAHNVSVAAKTVVAFMVSSSFGHIKEVVKLIPVKQLKGSELAVYTKSVLISLRNCNLKVLTIITDNNRVNRVLFDLLIQEGESKYFFQIPNCSIKTFVTYDTVHVLKNIRNNWLNIKNDGKTFFIPTMEDSDAVLQAKFSDVVYLYKKECSMLIKSAPKLSNKTVYPSTFERQKVSLVLNIFNETTAAALSVFLGTESGTAYFINLILKWWTIMNIKRSLTCTLKRNGMAAPFKSTSDERLIFLEEFIVWLKNWNEINENLPIKGTLTKDTSRALCHCTKVIVEVIKYSLNYLNVQYVLPGKFQTDNLESRFGCYRQLAGGNYNISVRQVFEAEQKMRSKSILGLHSARYGNITMCANFHDLKYAAEDIENSTKEFVFNNFSNILTEDSLELTTIDKSGLYYISGYISFQISKKVNCLDCVSLIANTQVKESEDKYFQLINRGGLSVPTDFVIQVTSNVIAIMQSLISEKHENVFLSMSDKQKDALCLLSEQVVFSDRTINHIVEDTCICGRGNTDTFTFVKTWPQNNADAELYRQRQRQAASGQDRNIPRNQPFQSSYNSDQHGVSQARRDDSTSQIGLWDQFGNNATNIHAQTISKDSQQSENRGHQGASQALEFNSSTQRTVPNNSRSYEDTVPAIRTSENRAQNSTARSDPCIPANNVSSYSKTNKQGQSAGARSSELHAVSRGNRRVATNSASQKAQALANSNESLDKYEENRFQTNFPKVSFSENNHKLEEENIQNKSRTVVLQSRTQPVVNLTGSNHNFRESIPTVKNFQNNSNTNVNNSSTLSVQGRIVTPVIIRGTRPDISTDVREWEGIAAAAAGVSSSEFKGDSVTSGEASGGAIVFPDARFKPRVTGNKAPECAQGTTFCTEAENYPLPQLSSILQNEINYKEYFGVDKEETITDDEIRQRIGPVDGDPLCRSQEKLIFPKIAQNKDDEWMYVVNLDKDYVQGVRIEVCEKEASPCQLSEGLPPGYTTYCRQKYIYRKLLAVGDDGKPAPDSFKLPSCCACFYRKTSIVNRILSVNSSAISKPQG